MILRTSHIISFVEDHEDFAALLLRALARARPTYNIVAKSSYRDAIEAAKQCRFDWLLCDIGLPDGDGCKLLTEVWEQYPVRGIALTAYAFPSELQRCLSAGSDDLITKPARLEVILNSIDRVASQSAKKGSSGDFASG